MWPLCHLPPLTLVCRAANIASVQIGAGANFRCTQLPSTLAPGLVVSDTIDASTVMYLLFSGLWLSTFLPHFPSAPFALTHISIALPSRNGLPISRPKRPNSAFCLSWAASLQLEPQGSANKVQCLRLNVDRTTNDKIGYQLLNGKRCWFS